jgi:hypothetical protein
MKLKAALTLSLIVNAVLLAAAGYVLTLDVEDMSSEPYIISAAPAKWPLKDVPAPEPEYAGPYL